jgi:uncharacterized protein YjbI with pentapeptide repeats
MPNPTDISEHLTDSRRIEHKDRAVRDNVTNSDWSNTQLTRLVAIDKHFRNVRFSNATFDACYLRNCRFDSCDFTGVKFSSTNLFGRNLCATFLESRRYASKDKTASKTSS